MIVEFIGTPGAGKTTFLPSTKEALHKQGFTTFTVVEAARDMTQRTLCGRMACRLTPEKWHHLLLWQIFLSLAFLYRIKFMIQNLHLTLFVLRSQLHRPQIVERRQRKVLYWYFRLMGYVAFLKAHLYADEVLLLDEGFVHRVVQLFTSDVEEPQERVIAEYLAKVPCPDLVIFVQAPWQLCAKRIFSRGLWPRAQHKQPREISQFVFHADTAVQQATTYMKRHNWAIVELENEKEDLVFAETELQQLLSDFFSLPQESLPVEKAI